MNEAGNDMQVMQCSDGSYCCGSSIYSDIATYCCSGGQGGVWIVDGEETNVNPNLSAAPFRAPSSTTPYSRTSSHPAALTSVQPRSETTVLEVVSSAPQPRTDSSPPGKTNNDGNPNLSAAPFLAPSSTTSCSPTISDPTASTSVRSPSETTVLEVVPSAPQPTTVATSSAKSDNDCNWGAKVGGALGASSV